MDFGLTDAQRDLQERARTYAEELRRFEVPCELGGGRLPAADVEVIARRARELGLGGGNPRGENGGLGWSMVEHVIVQEELGTVTNGVWWLAPGAYNVLGMGTEEQRRRYLAPTLAGELVDAYAVTERDAGSDAAGIAGRAERLPDGRYRIHTEKRLATSGGPPAAYHRVAHLDADPARPTPFLVDAGTPGVEVLEEPAFTHTYPGIHPTMRFECVVGPEQVLGGEELVGQGAALQNAWFVEERIHIAARCVGAMRRLLEETVAWAEGREQFGAPIIAFQGVGFPLADSAADCVAARLMTYQLAQMVDDGADPKLCHARASMAKLFASEAAHRCADRCVQAFGGRGYRRDNVAERLLRELRVDGIWEGTSEIQRIVIANALRKRGVAAVLEVATR